MYFPVYDVRTVVEDVRMLPCGANDSREVEDGLVYLKRSLPASLTTTATSKSATQISKFLFSQRYLMRVPDEKRGLPTEYIVSFGVKLDCHHFS